MLGMLQWALTEHRGTYMKSLHRILGPPFLDRIEDHGLEGIPVVQRADTEESEQRV
jgi:hypothetical protein